MFWAGPQNYFNEPYIIESEQCNIVWPRPFRLLLLVSDEQILYN